MGGAVSSGESNDELVDNLMSADYIKSPQIESIFRAVDRGFYFTKAYRSSAYKDLAWKDGNLHISAPCIYSEVMENLKLKRGMSFLNIGSGTGYLSTVVGLVLGRNGVNHGIEVHPDVVLYARAKLNAFIKSSAAIDIFDFCVPEFVVGNCLDTVPNSQRYDRIYCGAACGGSDIKFILDLLKIGGLCIVPMNDSLVQITRSGESRVETKTLLPVSFASLIPTSVETKTTVNLPPWNARKLSDICRSEIRDILRRTIEPPPLSRESPEPIGEEERKKRRKKRNDRRRANRLLLVQRRRNGEGNGHQVTRNPGFMAIAYSAGDRDHHHTSSDEEGESGRCRNRCNHTKCSNNRPSSRNRAVPIDSATESEEAKLESRENGVVVASSSSGASGSPIRRSRLAPNHAEGLSSSSEEPPSRRPRTELILERIREIIHNRQLEREQREEPEQPEEILNECIWSSDETSSSSSTSTSSSSDSDDLMDEGRGQVLDINDLEANNSSEESNMEPNISMPQAPLAQANGLTNIEAEIEFLNTESTLTPILHPTSLLLAKKVDQLNIPQPIKKFLNYNRLQL